MSKKLIIPDEVVISKIHYIRGQKVMLDKDLAELYGVETKRLKEQVRRNIERFPERYMFDLTEEEFKSLRSQIVTSKKGRGGTRYLPMAFTEHGILQLANALKSGRAIQVSIRIIDVFVKMPKMLLTHKDLLREMEAIRKKITGQDEKIELIFNYLKQFINEQETPRKRIGFKNIKRQIAPTGRRDFTFSTWSVVLKSRAKIIPLSFSSGTVSVLSSAVCR